MSRESIIDSKEKIGRGGVVLPEPLDVLNITSRSQLIGFFREFWGLNGHEMAKNYNGSLVYAQGQQAGFEKTMAVPNDPNTGDNYQIISEYDPTRMEVSYWVPYQTSLKQAMSNGYECHRLVKTPRDKAGPLIDVIKVEYYHVVAEEPHRTCGVDFQGKQLETEGHTSRVSYNQDIADISKFFIDSLS